MQDLKKQMAIYIKKMADMADQSSQIIQETKNEMIQKMDELKAGTKAELSSLKNDMKSAHLQKTVELKVQKDEFNDKLKRLQKELKEFTIDST